MRLVGSMSNESKADEGKEKDIEQLKKKFTALKAETASASSSAIENIEEKARRAKEKLVKTK
jgi:hypothetical protein